MEFHTVIIKIQVEKDKKVQAKKGLQFIQVLKSFWGNIFLHLPEINRASETLCQKVAHGM